MSKSPNFRMKDNTKEKLKIVAAHAKLSMTDFIDQLVQAEYERMIKETVQRYKDQSEGQSQQRTEATMLA